LDYNIVDISNRYNFNIIEMEVDLDYIHLLLSYGTNVSVLSIVKLLKQISTYCLWKNN
jgi:putative transposase